MINSPQNKQVTDMTENWGFKSNKTNVFYLNIKHVKNNIVSEI